MREILLNICLVAAAAALFRIMVPAGSFRKQIGFMISCFFITAVASFITNAELIPGEFASAGVTFGDAGYADFSGQTTAERKRAIGEEVSSRIYSLLAEAQITPKKVYVIVNISGTYSISINEIKLVLPPDEDFALASALVEREVGRDIKVTIEIEEA